jgi:hypothetical protein
LSKLLIHFEIRRSGKWIGQFWKLQSQNCTDCAENIGVFQQRICLESGPCGKAAMIVAPERAGRRSMSRAAVERAQ